MTLFLTRLTTRLLPLAWSLTFVLGFVLAAFPVSAKPAAPLKILVGYSAGGAVDTVARILGEALAEVLQEAVVIENRPARAPTLPSRR